MTAVQKTSRPDTGQLRAHAEEFLNEAVPPRYETIQQASHDFRRGLWQLIEHVEQLTRDRSDDVPSRVAMAGVGEARRRLDLIERPGLHGEFERVKRLGRSVIALCDHYDALTGVRMCVACDEPIGPGDDTLPYDQVSPSGGAGQSGRIHVGCAQRVRRR